MEPFRLLIVDDEEQFLNILKSRMERKGLIVTAFSSSLDALDSLKVDEYDVALFDIMMNNMSGLELLDQAKEMQPLLEVVMLTGYGTIETSIEAMKKGAFDYLQKPINPEELEIVLSRAYEKKALKGDKENLLETIKITNNKTSIIGESNPMKEMKYIIEKVADSHLPILILGESGTGKDLVANALHYRSCRSDKPFIPINASAIPGNLLESELFGHVKGSFTGAHTNKKGLVEIANGGTLFLDEIGDMDTALQVKLLRFLDTGEFRPVGSTITKKTSVRIVTATNKDLHSSMIEGKFREDLYYRLSVVNIMVPSLRDRGNDKILLADYFLNKSGNKDMVLSNDAKCFLLSYDFPGNVRELENIIERGILLSKGDEIDLESLFPNPINKGNEKDRTRMSLNEVEKEHINTILSLTDWDKPAAAKILGIGLRTLYRKIDLYELEN